jgi:hypothetical protein
MAKVTGDWGGQNIELFNAATEETQLKVANTLAQLHQTARQISQDLSSGTGIGGIAGAGTKATKAIEGIAEGSLRGGAAVTGFAAALKALGSGLLAGASAAADKLRMFDGGMTDLTGSIHGVTEKFGSLGRLIDSSAVQLQRQYQAYTTVQQVGGSAALALDDLQLTASKLGVSQEAYAGLVAQLGNSLTVGGGNVAKNLAQFNKMTIEGVVGQRKNSEMLIRMGYGMGDQAAAVSKVVAAMGGMERVMKSVGGNAQKFGDAIVDDIAKTTRLASVFGLTSDQLLSMRSDAMKDATTRTSLAGLEMIGQGTGVDAKAFFDQFLAATGDRNKALELTQQKVMGMTSDIEADIAAMGGDRGLALVKDPKEYAERMAAAFAKIMQNPNISKGIALQARADTLGIASKYGKATEEIVAANTDQMKTTVNVQENFRELNIITADFSKNLLKVTGGLVNGAIALQYFSTEIQEAIAALTGKTVTAVGNELGDLVKKIGGDPNSPLSKAMIDGMKSAGSAVGVNTSGAPTYAYGTATGTTSSLQGVNAKIIQVESNGKNIGNLQGTSSAFGLAQFTKGTFEDMAKKAQPGNPLYGKTFEDYKRDTNLQMQALEQLTASNQAFLKKNGIEPNDANTYLAHFLGPAGALRLLKSDPNTPIQNAVNQSSYNANRSIFDKYTTAGAVQQWAARKMGSASPVITVASTGGPTTTYTGAPVQTSNQNATVDPTRTPVNTVAGAVGGNRAAMDVSDEAKKDRERKAKEAQEKADKEAKEAKDKADKDAEEMAKARAMDQREQGNTGQGNVQPQSDPLISSLTTLIDESKKQTSKLGDVVEAVKNRNWGR